MFKSELSGKVYGYGVKPVRVVMEMREKTYQYMRGKYAKQSKGWEIVKEMIVGPDEVIKLGKSTTTQVAEPTFNSALPDANKR